MTDKEKLAKVRAEIERRYDKITTLPIGKDEHWEAILGAKAATLHSLLSFIDSMQKEPKECMYSKDNYTDEDRKVLCDGCEEECVYKPTTEEKKFKISDTCLIQYANREAGIKAHAEDYSFNIESELFQQLTPKQQKLWRKELEQAVVSGGHCGLELAKDKRYDEEPISEDLEEVSKKYSSCIYLEEVLSDDDKEILREKLINTFKAGANWKKQKMLANAVDGFVIEDIEEGNGDFLLSAEYLSKDTGLKDRQKVKVIVIKED